MRNHLTNSRPSGQRKPDAWLFRRGEWLEISDPMGDHETPEAAGYTPFDMWGNASPAVEIFTGDSATSHRWVVYLAIADVGGCEPIAVDDLPSLLMLMQLIAPLGICDLLADAQFRQARTREQ